MTENEAPKIVAVALHKPLHPPQGERLNSNLSTRTFLRAKEHGVQFEWRDPFLVVVFPKGGRAWIHASAIATMYEEQEAVVTPIVAAAPPTPPLHGLTGDDGPPLPALEEPPKKVAKAK